MENRLSRQLTPSQRQAVFHTEGPLLVIAGPGSGKTRVITHRIAALIESGVRPYNICAITFTNKAAEEMRQRALALGASAGAHISTFHSLCVRILRRYADRAGINANFSIYDEADQLRCAKQAVKDLHLDATNFPPSRMLDAISALKNKLTDAASFKAEAYDFFSSTLAGVYEAYQKLLSERNGVDFDDLLMKTAVLLRDCPEVCSELSDRFKFVLIDEYQDTNYAQYKIAELLVSRHNNICATGDPDQSIYRWRGADIRNIMAFESDWPDATIIKLEENFRSAANILAVADKLISFNKNRKQKKLIPTKPAGENVALTAFEDESEEVEGVTRQIEELVEQGACLNGIAVFYRVNAQSRALEEALIRRRVRYQVVRGVEFYRRKEIRDLLAYLKILVNPSDEIALLRIINTPKRGIGKTTIDRIRAYAERTNVSLFEAVTRSDRIEALSKGAKLKLAGFANMVAQFRKDVDGPVAPLAERMFAESGLAESLAAEGAEEQVALENVNELINSAADYDRQAEEPSLLDYLQQISLFSDADAYDANSESVKLMTLHAAKGLEFENVFIVGVEEDLLPHERSNSDEAKEDLEEERRLFFVGITRAIARLHISCCRYRTVRGQELRKRRSQFLFELGEDVTEQAQEDDHFEDEDRIQEDVPEFAPGQLVRHDSFGLGRVEKFVDMG
ncbi:MAG: UvrD-helicase domain-containing protein, partial [Phycisphaerales bacterium]